jgi:hypothetical protein
MENANTSIIEILSNYLVRSRRNALSFLFYDDQQGFDMALIYDENWQLKGHIQDWKIYDRNWQMKGWIEEAKSYDRIFDPSYKLEGYR